MEYLVIFLLVLVASLCGSLLANKLAPREVVLPSKEGDSLTSQFLGRVDAMEAAVFKLVHGITPDEYEEELDTQDEWLYGVEGGVASGEEEES